MLRINAIKPKKQTMSTSRRFLPPIPDDCQIFWGDVEVAGLQHHRAEAVAFIKGKDPQIHLQADPSNRHDPNAIAVHGSYKGLFGRKTKMLGFVPAEIARIIAEESLGSVIQPRLRNLYSGDHDFAQVQFDILGPKSRYKAVTQRAAQKEIENTIENGEFQIPRSNVDKNFLGMSCEKAGEIDRAVLCYEACIRNSFDGNHPYDRLLAIYRKRKDAENELRVIRKAIKIFEKAASTGRSDGQAKLQKYQKRLEEIQPTK